MNLEDQKQSESNQEATIQPCVLALSGGIGGAKLMLGLSKIMTEASLVAVVNTGDDFEHLGLSISPDIDTLIYTLAGINNQEMGWGRAGETWTFMKALESLGGETWFNLGDGDLALHLERTRRLAAGETLTEVTDAFCKQLGIPTPILPMSNDPVRTLVQTENGPLAFQHYFVRDQCRPAVTGFVFEGADAAQPNPEIIKALASPALEAIVICPSNPFISIDPILSVPGLQDALSDCPAPVVAVTPIVGDKAIKGPTAKIMNELGLPMTAVSVARHYQNLIDGFVLDQADVSSTEEIQTLGMTVKVTNTLMNDLDERRLLARAVLDLADRLH